jgi:hypothetical protein
LQNRHEAAKKQPAGAMDGPAGVKGAGSRPRKTAGNGQEGVAGVKWRGQEPNNMRFAREISGATFPATRNATQFRPIASSCSPVR